MKKYLFSTGVLFSVILPITTIISCNKNKKKKDHNVGKTAKTGAETTKTGSFKLKNGNYIVYKNNKTLTKKYGLKNFVNSKITNINSRNKKEYRTRISTGEVYAPHFRPADIPFWKPENETDGNYTRSSVPLSNRKFVLENVTKTKTKGRYFAMDTLRRGTSNSLNRTSNKGSNNSQIIQGLQYMTDMIAFGGSVGEGVVYIPRAQDIDAYHRMGVKIHATIFFAPSIYGGTPQDYADLLGNDLGKTADNLIKMAKYYGFDGWFINEESLPPSNWYSFMKIFHKKAKKENIEISYYTNSNKGSIYEAGHNAYDIWFNDYPNSQGMAEGVEEQESPKGYKKWHSYDAIRSAAGKSFWTFKEWEVGRYYENEKSVQQFYNGLNKNYEIVSDPRVSSKNGMAYWYKEYTPFIEHKSFSTSFGKGEGAFYNFEGRKIENSKLSNGYSNMAMQDYLPTWKYIIDVVKVNGKVDKTKIGVSGIKIENKETPNAWMGSDALVYSGTMNKNTKIINKLFASEITLKENDFFSIMYKGNVKPSLAIWTKNNSIFKKNIIRGKIKKEIFANNYKKMTFNINFLKGQLVSSFGLAFKNGAKDKSLSFTLGKMSFIACDEKTPKETKVKKLVNDGEWFTNNGKNIRLRWIIENRIIKEYLIYATDDEYKNKQLIDITTSPSAVLRNLKIREKNYIIIVPIDKMRNPLKEIKVCILGQKLDFNDDSKWTHKILSTNYYGYKTGHKFVGKALDGEGGMYLVNDQVQLIHINKYGVVQQGGDYKKIIFPGNLDNEEQRTTKETDFSTLFIGKTKKMFISRRYGGNGLYVFEKGLKKTNNEWQKFKDDNSIFKGKDNNGKMEYIAKMFQDEDDSLILISSLGNLRKINKNGILDKTYNKTFDANNKNEITKISAIKLGKNIIINYHFKGEKKSFEKIIKENNVISNITTDKQIGYVLDNKETKDTIVISTLCLVDKHFEVFIKVYDKKQDKITKSVKVKINLKANSSSNAYISPKNNYYNAFTLSSDGKNLIFRDVKYHSSINSSDKDFVKKNSYIIVLSIREILEKSPNPIIVKPIYVKHSVGDNCGGGDFTIMTAIGGLIYYGTSDFGRVGAIKVDYNDLQKTSLVKVKSIIYKFTKPNGKKMAFTTLESLKVNDNFPKNPNKIIEN